MLSVVSNDVPYVLVYTPFSNRLFYLKLDTEE